MTSANSLKCPVVKDYRAALTKRLLAVDRYSSQQTTKPPSTHYHYNAANSPALPPTQQASINPATSDLEKKMDNLLKSSLETNQRLERIERKSEVFDAWMKERMLSDEKVAIVIDELKNKCDIAHAINTQHELKIARHEHLLTKLVLPCLDELSRYLSHLNVSLKSSGRVDDADFNSLINRIRVQIQKSSDGNPF